MNAKDFVSRLQKVKSKGPDKWMACCPAHEDNDPSLSIAVSPGGKILLKCWTGCGAPEVVHAMGLTLADLFEKPLDYEPPMAFAQREMKQRRERERWIYRARLMVALAESDRQAGKKQSDHDRQRELAAVRYLIEQGAETTPDIVLMGVQEMGR